jgi:hypothetical protein
VGAREPAGLAGAPQAPIPALWFAQEVITSVRRVIERRNEKLEAEHAQQFRRVCFQSSNRERARKSEQLRPALKSCRLSRQSLAVNRLERAQLPCPRVLVFDWVTARSQSRVHAGVYKVLRSVITLPQLGKVAHGPRRPYKGLNFPFARPSQPGPGMEHGEASLQHELGPPLPLHHAIAQLPDRLRRRCIFDRLLANEVEANKIDDARVLTIEPCQRLVWNVQQHESVISSSIGYRVSMPMMLGYKRMCSVRELDALLAASHWHPVDITATGSWQGYGGHLTLNRAAGTRPGSGKSVCAHARGCGSSARDQYVFSSKA